MPVISPPVLLLTSAILHAGWNTMTKVSKDKEIFVFVTIVLACVWVIVGRMIFNPHFNFGGADGVKYGLIAGLFEGGYLVALAKSFNRTSLAKGYSIMRGGAMVFVWIISLSLSMESLNYLNGIGSLVILVGVALTGVGKKASGEWKEMIWPGLGALFIGAYHISYGAGLKAGAEPEALYVVALAVSVPFIFYPVRHGFARRAMRTLSSEKLKLLGSTLGASVGFVMFLYGLSRSGPGYAITLRNSSIFFSVFFSYLIKDQLGRAQVLGAVTIGIGAVLMGLS